MAEIISMIFQILYMLNILFLFLIVFVEKRSPTVTWAWAVIIVFVPYFGFAIYLLLGLESRKHNIFVQKALKDEDTYKKYVKLNYESLHFLTNPVKRPHLIAYGKMKDAQRLNDMVYLNQKSAQSAFTVNNSVKVFSEGVSKFESLIRDIGSAQRYIHMQYYIVRDSVIGRRLIAALAQKAKQGVTVRFFVDGMGSVLTKRGFYKPLTDAGGMLAVFQPPHFIRLNFRNHRKIAVIDGITGYVGGLNIGDEYLGASKRFGYWRDLHLRIYGDAVKQLQLRFMMDWNFTAKAGKIGFDPNDFPCVPNITGGVGMQIVSGGPDTKLPNIHYGYSKMIFEADRSIYIVTPYFVPDDTVFKSLKIAALSGIDVRIIIPAHPDHPFVYWSSLSYLGELLAAGVRCYKYERGFIHSKMILIDSAVSSVGTANMDIRSFDLNFEVNAFIYDEKTAHKLERIFFGDLKDCTEITKEIYDMRSNFTRFRESISRLISPLL